MRSGVLSSTAPCLSALDYESPMMYRTYFHANQSQIICKDNRARRTAFLVWYNLVFHAYFMYPKFIFSGEICRTVVRFLKNIYSGSYRVNWMTINHVHNLFKFVVLVIYIVTLIIENIMNFLWNLPTFSHLPLRYQKYNLNVRYTISFSSLPIQLPSTTELPHVRLVSMILRNKQCDTGKTGS